MMILIIMGLCALPLFILGLFMRKGKGLMLLAGYNTMSKPDRDKIDKKTLSKMAGNLLLRMSLELVMLGVTMYLGLTWAYIAFLIILLADPCVLAVKMSRKTKKTATSKTSRSVFIAISAVVCIAVAVMFIYGEKDPFVRFSDQSIQIDAMYGVNLSVTDITEITLIDQCMKDIGIGQRTNGYGGIGSTLKGHFYSEPLGDHLLFVKSESSPTIFIGREGTENIYISFSNAEKTKTIFAQLKAVMTSA